jgi:hypothetical protein
MHLKDIYRMGIHFIGRHLIGMYLAGMYRMGVHLMGVYAVVVKASSLGSMGAPRQAFRLGPGLPYLMALN